MLLTVSWIFFHAGASSTLATQKNVFGPAHTALATILSSSCAGCLIFVGRPIVNFFGKEEGSAFDPVMIVNCQVAGLVAISASCNRIEHYSSCIIGVIASILFMISRVILQKLQIDDPLNVISINLVCGVWGLIAAGIFSNSSGLISSGNPDLITTQIYAILAILTWASTTSFFFF